MTAMIKVIAAIIIWSTWGILSKIIALPPFVIVVLSSFFCLVSIIPIHIYEIYEKGDCHPKQYLKYF